MRPLPKQRSKKEKRKLKKSIDIVAIHPKWVNLLSEVIMSAETTI